MSHTKRNQIVLRALLLIPRAAQICHLVPLIASGTSQAQIETSKLSFGVRFRHVLQRYKRCFGLSGVGRVGCMLCHLWHGGSLLSFSKTSNLINEQIEKSWEMDMSRYPGERARERNTRSTKPSEDDFGCEFSYVMLCHVMSCYFMLFHVMSLVEFHSIAFRYN